MSINTCTTQEGALINKASVCKNNASIQSTAFMLLHRVQTDLDFWSTVRLLTAGGRRDPHKNLCRPHRKHANKVETEVTKHNILCIYLIVCLFYLLVHSIKHFLIKGSQHNCVINASFSVRFDLATVYVCYLQTDLYI